MSLHEPMKVARRTTDHESHIEPPLDPTWSELDKLRWQAGVVEADTGAILMLSNHHPDRLYGVSYRTPSRSSSISARPFAETWAFMWAFGSGVQYAKEQQ